MSERLGRSHLSGLWNKVLEEMTQEKEEEGHLRQVRALEEEMKGG